MMNKLIYCLLCTVVFPLLAGARSQEVALVGEGFGRTEIKSIITNVINRSPDGLGYMEFEEFMPVEEFPKFDLVVFATAVSRPYTTEEAKLIGEYVEKGGRILFIHQAYRSAGEVADRMMTDPRGEGAFEAWLGKGRSFYRKAGVDCTVFKPEDPLLAGVFQKTPEPVWLQASVVLRNEEFENLVGRDEEILVGRKKVGKGVVYYLGSELFRMLLPQYKERHADSEGWIQLLENIFQDRTPKDSGTGKGS